MGRPYDPKSKTKSPEYWGEQKHFKRYGITPEMFQRQMERQLGRCVGCMQPFSSTLRPRIDHDHTTGTFRGLLCHGCNVGLGFLKEDKSTLRRLIAYTEHDWTKRNVYVMGALKNPQIPKVGEALRKAGFNVWDDWYAAGPDADDCWKAYEEARGHSYVEALSGRAAQNTFLFDRAHIDLSDCVVLVMPAGRSGHLELGYARGLGKPGFILLSGPQDRFEVMPNFATEVCDDLSGLIRSLNAHLPGEQLPIPRAA